MHWQIPRASVYVVWACVGVSENLHVCNTNMCVAYIGIRQKVVI
jgi:hypothetical protein